MNVSSWIAQLVETTRRRRQPSRRVAETGLASTRGRAEVLEVRTLLTPLNVSILSSSQRVGADSRSFGNDDTAALNDHLIADADFRSTGSGFSGGDIELWGGDNLTVNTGVVLSGTETVELNVDYYGSRGFVFPAPVDPDPNVGGIFTLNGGVRGPQIEIFGHTDNDTFIINSSGIVESDNFTIDGWEGNDTATLELTGATNVTLTRNSNSSAVLTFTRSGGGSETVTFRNVETINTTGVTPTLVDNDPPDWVSPLPNSLSVLQNTASGADMNNAGLLSQLQTLATDVDDSFLDFTANPTTFPLGTTSVMFTATDDAGNSAQATIDVIVQAATLTVDVTATSISENGGSSAATVTRNSTTGALVVSLASDDTTEAAVPATVTIPNGQTSATFTVNGVDDSIVDGTQNVTITATATGHSSGSDTLEVTDDDVAGLTVTIAAASVSESDGPAATTATVSRNTDTTTALTVSLSSSDLSEATVPAAITIPAGQTTSAAFDIDAIDDAVQDGNVTVTVTATAAGHADGTDTLVVLDDEVQVIIVSTDTDIDDNNLADGELSLREAVRLANVDPDLSEIRFTDSMVGSTILLTNGQFELTQNVSIIGPGLAGDLVIDAQQNSRVFRIASGVTAGISRLSVTGGDADDNAERDFSGSLGGGILNAGGTLTLDQVRVFNNVATWGGGINNYGDGGTATLTVRDSTIDQNTANSNAGGLYNWGNNGQAVATVLGSTIARNTATGGGGGMESWPATTTLNLINSSIISNRALGTNAGGFFAMGAVVIGNSTIAGNSAALSGGGFSSEIGGTVTLTNTIVAGNSLNNGTARDIDLIGSGTIAATSANNLIGDAATAGGLTNDTDGNPATGSNNIVGVDWKTVLANDGTDPTLADNGGLTQTVALLPNSPAIDAGSNALAVDQNAATLITDQRGFKRILDGDNNGTATVDIGAVEAAQVAPAALVVSTNTDVVDGDYSAGELSLREAIHIANGRAGSDEISFATNLNNETITLGGTELLITDSLTINGPGAGQLTIDGNLQSRIFNVSAAAGAVTLSGVTLTKGQAPAGEDGGAILSAAGSALVITDSVITNNNADGKGGGVRTTQSTVNISGSTIADNRSVTDSGGGVDAASGGTISSSTISGNRSQGVGGGVATGNSLTVVNSTVTGNTSNDDGGGIWVFGGDVRIMNSTFAGNTSGDDGGAAFIRSTVGKLTIHNSILAGNTGNTADVFSQAGTEDVRNSLIGDNTGLLLPTDGTNNNQVGVDWKTVLENDGTDPILADNGGPTLTVALLPGSPAIDAGGVVTDVLITPTIVTSSTSADDLYPAGQLIDGSGLSQALTVQNVGETTHSFSGSSTSWVTTDPNGGSGDYFDSGSPGPDPVLTFNLPEVSLLTDIAFWGYNQLGFRNGAKTISVAVSTDGGTTFSDAGTVTLQIPTANVEILPMPGGPRQANAVRLTITDNHYESGQPGGDRVGLAEVRFLGFSAGAFDQRGPGFDRIVDGDEDGTATIDIGAFEFEPTVLSVNITETSISENGGTGTATVSRTGPTSTELIVTLASDDTGEGTVPATVTIAAGEMTSPEFTIKAVDDAIVDGTQTVTVTASATGAISGSDTIGVTDDDIAAITISIVATSVGEGDGATATTATVSRNTDTTSALTVTLSSDDTSEATVPATVNIPAGQATSAVFNIAAVDDAVADGPQTVTITASATGLNSGTDTVIVTDDETASLTLTIAAASIAEGDGTTATTAIVSRDGDTSAELTVTLTSDDIGEATVPATVTIPAGQATSAVFNIAAVDDAVADGPQTVTITASATGLNSGTDTVIVTDDDTASLTLTIAAASIAEGDGATATTATVSRDGDTSAALTVTLTSDDTSEATVPATVTIPAGQATSAVFNIAAVDDAVADGPQTVTVTASATGLNSGTDTVIVTDDDTNSQIPGDVDGDGDFDANDSFLVQLAKLSGTDAQIDQSRGSSTLTAPQIRGLITALETAADVDGDSDFDANDSFLIHLVKLSGTNAQIDQSKGSSSLTAPQIRARVDALGASSSSSTASVRAGRRLLPPASLPPGNTQTVDADRLQLFSGTGEAELREVQAATEMADSDELVTVWQQFRQWIDIL